MEFMTRWRRAGAAPFWRRIAQAMLRRWQWGARATSGWLNLSRRLCQTGWQWRRFARAMFLRWLVSLMSMSRYLQHTSTWQLEEWSAETENDGMFAWLCDFLAMRDEQRWRRLP